MISTALVCVTAIIIVVLIINYLKYSHVSDASIQRMDARYNELFAKYEELNNKSIETNTDHITRDYKEIKDAMAVVNQQIQSVNAKLGFSNLRQAVG